MIRPTGLVRFATTLCVLVCMSSAVLAQTATEFNDKDKKKLGEIAQRPEVIRRIQDTWDARRRADMEFAFNVNQSSRIGELSLPEGFNGVLPWGHIDNRPFLRCMHGFGLCLWRLGRFAEALRLFDRMLWLNPSDNQGVRFQIADVRAKQVWEDRREK